MNGEEALVQLENRKPQNVQSVMVAAANILLTAERTELPVEAPKDLASLQSRTQDLMRLLDNNVQDLTQKVESSYWNTKPRAVRLGKAILGGDFEMQAKTGLDFRGVRFDMVAQAVILGTPIESQMLTIPQRLSAVAVPHISVEAEAHRLEPAANLNKAIQKVSYPARRNIRTNILSLHDPFMVDANSAAADLIDTVVSMQRYGVIKASDQLGRDVYIKQMSLGDTEQLKPLVDLLRASPYGYVDEDRGMASFKPFPQYMDFVSRVSSRPPHILEKFGLPLYIPGMAMDPAVMALDALTKDPNAIRISLAVHDDGSSRQAMTFARMTDTIAMDKSHVIVHDATPTAAMLMQAGFMAGMLPYVRHFSQNLGRFDSPVYYNAWQYHEHNYGAGVRREQQQLRIEPIIEGMLDEDFYCRKKLVEKLYVRYSVRSFKTMIDEYCGPGTSLARIMAPFMEREMYGGSITLIDMSPSSVEFQQKWIDGELPPEEAKVAALDQKLFDMTRAAHYYHYGAANADDMARSLAKTKLGSFEELEPDSCDVLTDGYGSCSSGRPLIDGETDPVPPTYGDFCLKQKIKFVALREGGIAVSMHMVRRQNWTSTHTETDELIELPSVYLASEEEIRQAYMDAGFVNVYVEVIQVVNPHHKSSDTNPLQAAAMAIVIAEKPQDRPDHSKVEPL